MKEKTQKSHRSTWEPLQVRGSSRYQTVGRDTGTWLEMDLHLRDYSVRDLSSGRFLGYGDPRKLELAVRYDEYLKLHDRSSFDVDPSISMGDWLGDLADPNGTGSPFTEGMPRGRRGHATKRGLTPEEWSGATPAYTDILDMPVGEFRKMWTAEGACLLSSVIDPRPGGMRPPLVAWLSARLGHVLRGADLSSADLSWSALSCVDMRGSVLVGVDLRCADLSYTDLSGADLRGTDLRGAYLHATNFGGADLEGAIMANATLFYADFRGADLTNADFRGSYEVFTTVDGAILTGVYLDPLVEGRNWNAARIPSQLDSHNYTLYGGRVFRKGDVERVRYESRY